MRHYSVFLTFTSGLLAGLSKPMSFFYQTRGKLTLLARQLAVLLFFLFSTTGVFAQLDTEFWFAPPELTQSILPGTGGPRDRPIQLVVSTLEKAARVEILQPADLTFSPIVLNMPANSTQIVNLTPFIDRLESKPENTILKTGLLIRSTQSISTYYEIKSSNNTDIFALKGANANGKLFYVPFQTHWNNAEDLNGNLYEPKTYASFDIIATDDSTLVTVTPTKPLVGHPAGVPFTFRLNRGQVYSCRAIDRFGANHPAGSKIEATKEVAVTMKDDMLQFAPPVPGADIAGDQLIPVDFWGQQYVLVKGGLSNNQDRCYILAAEDNTVIRVDGSPFPLDTLNEGEQFELQMTKESYFLAASKKVTVLHISGIQDQVGGAIIPALNCTGTNRIGFTRTNASQFIVNVITKNSARNNFTLNGDPTLVPGSAFQPITGSNGWVYARINFSTSQIPAGTTLLLQNSGDELFHVGVTNYAAGVGSNYGYFSNFSRLNLGINKNLCVGDTAILDAGPAKTSYLWSTGSTSRIIETTEPGVYWVNTLSGTQCPKTDTVRVNFYAPTFSLGADDTICIGSSVVIQPSGVFTYTWQDGSTGPTYTANQAGLYWAQVADFQGCTTRDSIQIFEFPRPVTPIASLGDTVCQGGIVSLTMGNVDGATYAWLAPNGQIISGKSIVVNTQTQPAGAYSAFIKINGCESFYDTSMVGIQLPPPLELGKDTVVCSAAGTVVLDFGLAQPGSTYVWNTGSSDTSITVTSSGRYKVTGTSPAGCVASDSILVTFQDVPDPAVFSGPTTFCSGQSASFGVNQETGYTYQWTGPGGFNQSGPLVLFSSILTVQSGTYSVTPFKNGCPGLSQDRVITVNPSPEISLGKDTASCAAFGLTLDPTPFGNGLTYLWNDGSSDSLLTLNTGGTYWVEANNGLCQTRDSITVTFGAGPSVVTPTGNRNYCAGAFASFGVVEVPGETYSWTGPNGFTALGGLISIADVSLSNAGTYTVTPSLPGCPGTPVSFNLVVRPAPGIIKNPDTSFCQGSGVVLDPVPFGGEETFYTWSTGDADSTLFVSAPGTYIVTATLGLCQRSDTIEVTSKPLPAALVFTGDSLVCPGSDANFGVQSESGVSYSWSGPNGFSQTGNSVSIPSISDSQLGLYTVTASLNGCSRPAYRIQISNPIPGGLVLPDNANICAGGSLVLDPVISGTGLIYSWNIGSTDSSLTVSSAGTYKVTVTKGSCQLTDSTVVIVNNAPDPASISGVGTYCSGDTLSLSANSQSGVVYNWSGPGGFASTGNSISIPNLTAASSGNYIVSPELNGCLGVSDTLSITVGIRPNVNLGPNNTLCNQSSIVLDPVANSQGFSFVWNDNSTDTTLTVSGSGTYYVQVSDGNCLSSDTISLVFGTSPSTLSITGSNEICEGASITLNTNATTGVDVNWTGPNGFTATGTSLVLSNLLASQAGLYIAIPNQNGCQGTGDSITLSIGVSPNVDLGPNRSICAGGTVTLDPVPNGSNFTYTWSNGSSDSSIVVSTPGTYFVEVNGGGTCSGRDTVDVNLAPVPSFANILGDTIYCTGNTAQFSVDSVSGVSYNWFGPNGFTASGDTIRIANVSFANGGKYWVVPSIGTCQGAADTIRLNLIQAPIVNLGPDDTICGNNLVTLVPTQFQAGYTYEWNVGTNDTLLTTNQSGQYAVSVRVQGCVRSDTVNLTFAPLPLPVTIEADAANCVGDTLFFTLQGTQAGTSYSWTGPNGFTFSGTSTNIPNATNAMAGVYQVTPVLESCQGTPTSVNVVINNFPIANLGLDLEACEGTSFTLDPTPSSSGLTYLWSNGTTDTLLVVTQTGQYSVAVSNGTSCVGRDTIQVQINAFPATLVFEGDTVYCEGESGNFGIVAQPGVSANWTGPNGFSFGGNSVSISNAASNQSGYYKVTPNAGSCFGTADSVFVLIQPRPQVNLGADQTFCGVSNFELSAGGSNLNYLWNTGSTASQISVAGSGIYWVEVTNQALCSSRDSIQLTFKTKPAAPVFESGLTTVCNGSQVNLTVTNPDGADLQWNGPNGFAANGNTISFVAQMPLNGTFLIIPTLDGCVGNNLEINLIVRDSPGFTLTVDSVVCKGQSTSATVAGAPAGTSFFWSNNNSGVSTQFGIGAHWVEASLNGCILRDSFEIRNSGPEAAFITDPSDSLVVFEEVKYLDQSKAGKSPINSWTWNLGFSQIRSEQNPSNTYYYSETTEVVLIVKDQAGCADTVRKNLEIKAPRGWFIPTLFTPNGDGDNDTFVIGELDKYPGTKVSIYNRWGKEQYSTDNYQNDWDGADLVEGVYFYNVDRPDGKSYQGYLMIRR